MLDFWYGLNILLLVRRSCVLLGLLVAGCHSTSLRLASVQYSKRRTGFPQVRVPVRGWAELGPMPGSTSSGDELQRSKQAQSQRLHSFCSLASLLIEWFAPLEVVVSHPRSPAVLFTVSQIWGCATASKDARSTKQESITPDVPKVPSQTLTINSYWSTATSVQRTAWHITLEPLLQNRNSIL